MTATYGAGYPARELSRAGLDSLKDYDICYPLRCIGWPDNPECLSHYPGACQDQAVPSSVQSALLRRVDHQAQRSIDAIVVVRT